MEQGIHWELGRWAHHLIPYEGGLHVFNVYGYSSDKERAQEWNREICLEIGCCCLGKPADLHTWGLELRA
eukprot:2514831-Amphidinium_carterae.1